MPRLQHKTALITGAARGIGEAMARAFVAEGALVYLTDIDDDRGRALAADLGERARYRRLDVRREADWQAVTEAILAEAGGLQVVVNNAGITGFEQGMVAQDPEHASLADWHSVHSTNLDGVFLGCKYAIRAMRRFGRPEEVAALAVMLASDEVPYMTGAELNIDGGILAGSAARPDA